MGWLIALIAVVVAGCEDSVSSVQDAAPEAAIADAAHPDLPLPDLSLPDGRPDLLSQPISLANYVRVRDPDQNITLFLTHLTRIRSLADFARVQDTDHSIKYLLRVDGRQAPAPLDAECIFQNTGHFPYHLFFILHFDALQYIDLDAYLDMVMRQATRVWWGGVLKALPQVAHPRTGRPGIIFYKVWRDDPDNAPAEALSVDQFVQVDRRLKKCMPFTSQVLEPIFSQTKQGVQVEKPLHGLRTHPTELLVLVPEPGAQTTHVKQIEPELKAHQVDVIYQDQLLP